MNQPPTPQLPSKLSMMPFDHKLFTTIETFAAQHQLIRPGMHLICGLSGGADSVFLLHFLAYLQSKIALTITAVHLDHEWRPDSGNDAALCQRIVDSLGIALIIKKRSALPNGSLKAQGSVEELGRILRRSLFESVRTHLRADAICLGHHLQDQQETFLLRLIRGSSLAGMTGIQPRSGVYIRPLLETSKSDIATFLTKHNIPFVHDSTNDSDNFLRNRLRHRVLPALATCDPRFDKNFLKTLARLQESDQALTQIVSELFDQIRVVRDGGIWLKTNELARQPINVQHRLLVYWFVNHRLKFPVSHSFLEEVLRFLKNSRSQRHQLTSEWCIVKEKGYATLRVLSS